MMIRHKIKWILYGFGILAAGIIMLDTGVYREGGPVATWAVIPTFIAGFVFTIYGFFSSPPKEKGANKGVMICPKCETTYIKKEAPKGGTCPDCNVPLEPLVGFYDRHPELKNKEDL